MGSRYGVKIRKKHAEIQAKSRGVYACVKCGKRGVRKQGFALWQCRSCGARFAGGAYSPETMVGAYARRILRGEKSAAQMGGAVDLEELAKRRADERAEENEGQ